MNIITDIGLNPALIGTPYIEMAISIVLSRPRQRIIFQRDVYPYIASWYDTTEWAVERAMRVAIMELFDKLHPNDCYKHFGMSIDPDSGVPSTKQLVLTLARLSYNADIRKYSPENEGTHD